MRKKNLLIIATFLYASITSCNKAEFLDAKPDESIIIPVAIQDFQAILDNNIVFNGGGAGNSGIDPDFLEVAANDYYIADSRLSSRPTQIKNLYVWNDEIYPRTYYVWTLPYKAIFYANNVLDGLGKISYSPTEVDAYNNLKGAALFYRARMFYQLAQVFAQPYKQETAYSDLGIPLRLTADINEKIVRSSVYETYQRILTDLKLAIPLLPSAIVYKTKPSKPAAYAMVAKTYLAMRDYENALLYADSCLSLYNKVMDYNMIPNTSAPPFSQFNDEVIFHSVLTNNSLILSPTNTSLIDTNLYNSYDENDLRKTLFFRPPTSTGITFKGSYDGSNLYFSGIATDELYFIRSECFARIGDLPAAISDLNYIMEKRWRDSAWVPISSSDQAETIRIILNERRKELVMRGLRWTDLRRLNLEGANITLTRVCDGLTYTLPPNDLRYTFLIPPDVLSLNPDMQQTPR